jgi:uncharacterized protein YjiS (DUF1127 family)
MITLPQSQIRVLSMPRIGSVARSFARIVALSFDAWRSRRALARLDDRALRDIGLTRGDAQIEANRPVWSVPAVWLG